MNLEEKIKNGWEVSAEGYSKRIVRTDFVSPGREIWTDLILSQAPRAGKLRILDVGTGPGVFATLLTLAGHSVTGIDVSPKMLEEARMNSAARGAFPDFLLMNSQNLTFDPESFDMIVSRYVVWTLEYPENVYESWLRILKPGDHFGERSVLGKRRRSGTVRALEDSRVLVMDQDAFTRIAEGFPAFGDYFRKHLKDNFDIDWNPPSHG